MKVQSVNLTTRKSYLTVQTQKNINDSKETRINSESSWVIAGMAALSEMNKLNFKGRVDFTLNLSSDELKKRTNKEFLNEVKLLSTEAPEYQKLAEGDKLALVHLVKAARVLNDVYLAQMSSKNLAFRDYLKKEVKKGSVDAKNTLRLFYAQNGIHGRDTLSQPVILARGENNPPQKAFYPADLTKEEFKDIIKKMLKDGKSTKVSKILNQRTMVVRSQDELAPIDYTSYFQKEFSAAADHLLAASKLSTNEDFNEYLRCQAAALSTNDSFFDAVADKKWAELQDTPLEFTIGREYYEDQFSGFIQEDKELKTLLNYYRIKPFQKDVIGVRVGIINKEGTKDLLKIKEYLPELAKNMPFNDEYEQNISSSKDNKQTMADADIVALTGHYGALRGQIVVASNLPNNDKPSLKIGGGKRNVYHRQVRMRNNPEKTKQLLDNFLLPQYHKYYDLGALHKFVISHENAHTLGPKKGTERLGNYKGIIEENKADIAAIAMLDVLVDKGMYTEFEKKQIITTYIINYIPKAKPDMSNAHRVRNLMQYNYFFDEGAIKLTKDYKLDIDFEKFVPAAKKMLAQIIRLQIDGTPEKAKEYIDKHFRWDNRMEKLSEVNKILNFLNLEIKSPLADALVRS